MTDLLDFLRHNPYPGRGIAISSDSIYYFIMGRSENSRNRVFETTEDGIRTRAFDARKVTDPSLILYHPVRRTALGLVVGNGDQTDTVAELGCWRRALRQREYEPDAPNYTPRITALLRPDGSFELSILKRAQGRCLREFFSFEGCDAGTGRFISTYAQDGDPLPSYSGEPLEIRFPEPEALWAALHPENKVALYANIRGTVRLFNKLCGD